MMQLQNLRIRRRYDQSLEGEIEIAGDTGKVALAVNDVLCRKLIEVCASELVDVAKTVARDMTAEMVSGPTAAKVLGDRK